MINTVSLIFYLYDSIDTQARNKSRKLPLSLPVSRQSGRPLWPDAAGGLTAGRPAVTGVAASRLRLLILLWACVSIESAQVLISYRSIIKETVSIIVWKYILLTFQKYWWFKHPKICHSHCNIALQTCRLCSCISDWAQKSNSKFTTEFFSTHVHIWSRVLLWSILNISNNSWPIWPRDMKEKTRLWSHDLFTISPQLQHLLKHNMCIVSMRLTRYIIDSSLRIRACIRIINNSTTTQMKYCLLSWLFIQTIESERALAAQKVHVHLRVRLHCEFCVFCFETEECIIREKLSHFWHAFYP